MFSSIFKLFLEERIIIQSPRVNVWNTLNSLDSWAQWNSVCKTASWIYGDPWSQGSKFSMSLIFSGIVVPFTVTVEKSKKPYHLKWSSTFLGITGTRESTVEEIDQNTVQVTDSKSFKSNFLPIKLFYPKGIINKMSQEWLKSLKLQTELMNID